ncbi:hypothetical protein LARI1_G005780 [Lachnellula arida]|uniref:Uncharacterized protein n=1 Tax=Lachnellula arida TaxID=1316785 RepID=A0A8T9BBB8_9HELO|nr:hypothetical protein LARI1_G005780 [Lachnellula arida]
MAARNTSPVPVPGPPGPLNPPPGPPAPYEPKRSTTGGNENENWAGPDAEGHCQISRCLLRPRTSIPPLPTGTSRMRDGYNEKMDIDYQRGGATHEYTEKMDTPQCLPAPPMHTIMESGKGTRNAVNENGAVQGSAGKKQAQGEDSTSGCSCSHSTGACSVNTAHVCTTNTTRPVHGLKATQSYFMNMADTEQDFARFPEMNTQSHLDHELGLLKRADHLMRTMDKGSRSKLLIESPLAAWGEQVKLEPGQILLMQCLHLWPDLWLHLALFSSHYHHAFLGPGHVDSGPGIFWQVPAVWQFIMGMPFQEKFLAYTNRAHLPELIRIEQTVIGQDPLLQVIHGTQILVTVLHDADPELHHCVVIDHHHEIIGDQEQDPHPVREVLHEDSLLEEMMIVEQDHPQEETKEEDQDPLTTEIVLPLVPGHLSLLEDHHPQVPVVVTAPVLEAQIVVITA